MNPEETDFAGKGRRDPSPSHWRKSRTAKFVALSDNLGRLDQIYGLLREQLFDIVVLCR